METGNQEVVTNLVANEGADISEDALQAIIDSFGTESTVQGSLVHRGNLPVTVAERLVTMVSDQWREHLISHHQLTGPSPPTSLGKAVNGPPSPCPPVPTARTSRVWCAISTTIAA